MSYFGIGIYHTKTPANIGSLMRSAYCFGASFVFTIGKRYTKDCMDTPNCGAQVPLYHYKDLQAFLAHVPVGCRMVGVELHEKARSLGSFCHFKQAVYLLGAEDSGLSSEALNACHAIVQVPGLRMCLNVAVAGSLVLFDRQQKLGGNRHESVPTVA